jgi:hypothetical protein
MRSPATHAPPAITAMSNRMPHIAAIRFVLMAVPRMA